MKTPDAPLPESLVAHASFVRGVARAVLRRDDRVDDVVQDTWVAALEHGASRRGPLGPWLAGIARHKALRVLRGDGRRARLHDALARGPRRPSAEALAERAELGRRVASAVLALEEPYRETLLLRYQEDLPPREIARRMAVPVDTVKTRIQRGLARLRRVLGAGDETGAWRLALLPLAYPRSAPAASLSSSFLLSLGGGIVMKKLLLVGLAALVLLGVGVTVERGWWSRAEVDGPTPEDATRDDAAAARLVGRVPPDGRAARPLPGAFERRGTDGDDLAHADRDRDLFGVVVDPDGVPVAGATLTAVRYPWTERRLLMGAPERAEADALARGVSGEDGSFRLPLGRGTQANLRVEAARRPAAELRRLQAGERVRVVLSDPVSLRLHIVDGGKRPVAGAWYRLRNGMRAGRRFERSGRSDAGGLVHLDDLPPGESVLLWVLGPPHAPGGTMGITLTLPEEGLLEEEIPLVATRVLRGRVLDVETHAPLPDVRVAGSYAMLPAVRTDEEGHFEMVQPRWASVPAVYVDADGYARTRVPAGDEAELVIELDRGWAVTGRVVDDAGRPLEAVLVRAIGLAERDMTWNYSLAHDRSGPDGRFHLHGLRRGLSHALCFVAEARGSLTLDVDPPEGASSSVGEVVLPPPRAVFGSVQDADGLPQAGVQVTLRGFSDGRERLRTGGHAVAWSWTPEMERRTDDLGRFRFPGLAPGTYTLVAESGTGDAVEQALRVDDADVLLDVRFAGTRRIRVRFLGPDGPIREGWALRPAARGVPFTWREPDAQGVVAFDAPHTTFRFWTWVQEALPFHRPDASVEVPEGTDRIDVRLTPASIVEGRLLDADGDPVVHALIEARWGDARPTYDTTRASGVFRLRAEPGVPVQILWDGRRNDPTRQGGVTRMLQTARVDGWTPEDGEVVLRARRAERGRALVVRVLDPEGRPLTDERVSLYMVPGVDGDVRTDAQGRARFEDLPALPIVARWSSPSSEARPWFVVPAEAVVPEGQEVVIRAARAVLIEGHVRLRDGAPAAGAGVRARAGRYAGRYAKADEAGRFLLCLDPHGPGRYDLEAHATDAEGRRLQARCDQVEVGTRGLVITLTAPQGRSP